MVGQILLEFMLVLFAMISGTLCEKLPSLQDSKGKPLCTLDPTGTFCEEVKNYPDEAIQQAVPYSVPEFRELFGYPGSAEPRRAGEEQTVCPQHSRIFYPKAAMSEEGNMDYIVNNDDYVQAIYAELCREHDQPCDYLSDGVLPSHLTSRCGQKYAFRRLLAVNPNSIKARPASFRFPSCCVCFLTRQTDFRSPNSNLLKPPSY